MKKSLIGKNLDEISDLCKELGVENFRSKQLFNWMYRNEVNDLTELKNLPKSLIDDLKRGNCIHPLELINSTNSSSEKTNKFLFKTQSGAMIESVLMNEKNRVTLCISTQVGCALDCKFCATAKMGFKENLSVGEIIDQYLLARQKINKPITNIVFMGMGEPFLNYKNVIKSCEIMNDSKGFNLSSKKITISTSGILTKIKQFISEKHKYKLAISLNASNNNDRTKLIPINKKWPIEEILSTLKQYKFKKYRPIMFEYVLIEGVNDSEENAIELSQLLKNFNCKINIIPYNETKENYKRSSRIDKFVSQLNKINSNYQVLIRWSKGQDIDAACGQLATLNE